MKTMQLQSIHRTQNEKFLRE